jgi:glycosyltransferase involved in cell wall biosynthesis
MSDDYQSQLVSVIVPTYNRAALLTEALESVRQQSYRPLEVLVADDGSTDDIAAIVKEFQRRLGEDASLRVRFLRQEHAGVSAARNLGLIESQGEFIQFLDSDDVLHPQKVMAGVLTLENDPAVGYVWTRRARIEDSKMADFIRQSLEAPSTQFCAARVPTRGLAWIPYQVFGLFRRWVCQKIGPWNESLWCAEDWEYITRLLCENNPILRINHKLYGLREHRHGRITDLAGQKLRLLEIKRAAAVAAEQYARENGGGRTPSRAFRMRLTRHYFRLLRQSIRIGSAEYFASAAAGMKRNFPWFGRVADRISLPDDVAKAA